MPSFPRQLHLRPARVQPSSVPEVSSILASPVPARQTSSRLERARFAGVTDAGDLLAVGEDADAVVLLEGGGEGQLGDEVAGRLSGQANLNFLETHELVQVVHAA